MPHIKTKVAAAPSQGWRKAVSFSAFVRLNPASGHASKASKQSKGTSSQRIHSEAASRKLLTTASKKPAPENPPTRTRVPGAVKLMTNPSTAAASAGRWRKRRRRAHNTSAMNRIRILRSPTT